MAIFITKHKGRKTREETQTQIKKTNEFFKEALSPASLAAEYLSPASFATFLFDFEEHEQKVREQEMNESFERQREQLQAIKAEADRRRRAEDAQIELAKRWLQDNGKWPVEGSLANCKPKSVKDDAATKANQKTNKRKRKDNLSRAIDAAIETLGEKPSFDALWQYFYDDRDETGFIIDITDDKLTWQDTNGKFQDTPRRTLANRLARIKI